MLDSCQSGSCWPFWEHGSASDSLACSVSVGFRQHFKLAILSRAHSRDWGVENPLHIKCLWHLKILFPLENWKVPCVSVSTYKETDLSILLRFCPKDHKVLPCCFDRNHIGTWHQYFAYNCTLWLLSFLWTTDSRRNEQAVYWYCNLLLCACDHEKCMVCCSILHPSRVTSGDTPGDTSSAGEFVRNFTAP